VWSPSSDTIYVNNTIVFLIAKVFTLADNPVLLESMYIRNYLGNPSSPGYGDLLSDVNAGTFFIASRTVISVPDAVPSMLKMFMVAASDYIRDEMKYSQIRSGFSFILSECR